jgi:hypothetical protein
MKLKLVVSRQGMVWVRQGLRVFFRRPMSFCMLFLLYLFIGPMLMFAVAPLATLGFMIATQQTLQNRFPLPGVFITPLRSGRSKCWAQIQLGLAYAVSVALVFWLSDMVGGSAYDALGQAVAAGKTSPEELQPLLSDAGLQFGWLLMMAGIALLSLPFWHAPALVHWGGQSAAKSLFFSTVACWRNKGALAVFSLTWGAVIVALAVTSAMIFSLLGVPQMAFAALTPAMLMLSAAFYASLYFTFIDSFEAAASVPPPTLETIS